MWCQKPTAEDRPGFITACGARNPQLKIDQVLSLHVVPETHISGSDVVVSLWPLAVLQLMNFCFVFACFLFCVCVCVCVFVACHCPVQSGMMWYLVADVAWWDTFCVSVLCIVCRLCWEKVKTTEKAICSYWPFFLPVNSCGKHCSSQSSSMQQKIKHFSDMSWSWACSVCAWIHFEREELKVQSWAWLSK